MEQEKARSEIAKQDQWSIEDVFSSTKQVDDALIMLEKKVEELISYKGKIMESSHTLQLFYQLHDAMDELLTKIYVYAHMKCDEDTSNAEYQAMKMKVDKKVESYQEKLSFIGPEMLKTPYDVVLKYIEENETLKQYQFDLEGIYRYQKHTLSEREEEIITAAQSAMGGCAEAFYNLDNADIHYGTVINDEGKEVELTNANYGRLMNSRSRNVRKNVFDTMYAYWKSITNTVAATLKGQIKENIFLSKIHNYNSPLEASLYADHIEKKVYTNLIDTVHKNLDKMYDYMEVRKDLLNVEELHMYDLYVDLVKEKTEDISFETGKQMIFEVLKPLGQAYLKDLEKAFQERWIDIYPNKGKKSGAYSWGSYGTKPYLLLNYDGTMDSVSTMAHELGHSMHSYYSCKTQPYVYSAYPIFLAEIASTVNEVLLNEYLYQNAKTTHEKMMYLTDFLDKVRTTIYRQTMFAEFELLIHEKEEQGIPLTSEEFSNTYYHLNQIYYGNGVVVDDAIRYEWEKIPHFYTSFYTYKYATGMSAAIAIVTDILNGKEGIQDAYLAFLASGGKDYPLELLKKVGIDMTTPEPIEKALDLFDKKLKELKQLCIK